MKKKIISPPLPGSNGRDKFVKRGFTFEINEAPSGKRQTYE